MTKDLKKLRFRPYLVRPVSEEVVAVRKVQNEPKPPLTHYY